MVALDAPYLMNYRSPMELTPGNTQASAPSLFGNTFIAPIGQQQQSSGGNFLSKFSEFANPISALASGAGNILSSIFGFIGQNKMIKAQKEMNERNVQAQMDINAANVASQEKINQQMLDFQHMTNQNARYDAKHAISDKKSDLARAGYSLADPSLQGFSTAAQGGSPSLGSATQVAPQVASEYDQASNRNLIDSLLGGSSGLTDLMTAFSTIGLQKAQELSTRADLPIKQVDAEFAAATRKAAIAEIYGRIDSLVTSNELNRAQAEHFRADIGRINTSVDLLEQQVLHAKFKTEHQAEEFLNAMSNLVASTSQLNSLSDLQKSQKSSVDVETEIKKYEKQIMEVKANLAKLGINFDSSNWVSVIGSIVASPNGTHLVSQCLEFITKSITDIISNFGKTVTGPLRDAWNNLTKKLENFHLW